MHDLLRIADLTRDELLDVVSLASRLKRDGYPRAAEGRCVAIVFEKPSLRTRFSIESALARIGAHAMGAYDLREGFGTREPVRDAARTLARYADAIVLRTFGHDRIEELAGEAEVPVVNALSDLHHPLQALADLQTLAECCAPGDPDRLKGKRVAWIGDGNNVAHSLIEAAALAGMQVACACPPGYEPDADVIAWSREQGGDVELTPDPHAAVSGACAVYTDVWASMGREDEADARAQVFAPYRVTPDLVPDGAIFLHCLPAHREEEVAAAVVDGPASRVFDQAENRMHTAAAVFLRILGSSDAS